MWIMTDKKVPDFMYAGASRCGSSWLYASLCEHPEIQMPSIDPVNFFDVRYFKGYEWYEKLLPNSQGQNIIGETSPGYMKNQFAPKRIIEHAPNTKVIFTVRDPVDRAFSEWWHEKSFGNLNWDFESALYHHPAFDTLVSPGFYDHHLCRFYDYFDEEQISVMFFKDFKLDNEAYIQTIYSFLEVDDSFTPSTVGEQRNEASHMHPVLNQLKSKVYHSTSERLQEKILRPVYEPIKRVLERKSTYKQGVNPDIRRKFEQIYQEDIRSLESRTGRDLSHWLRLTRE